MLTTSSRMILLAGLASLAVEAQAAPGGGAPRPVAQAASRPCSMDSLPEAQKQRLISEYGRRLRTEGKAAAQAWARAQSDRLFQQLVAEGVCPGPRGPNRRTAQATPRRPLNKQGKTCKNIEMETQAFPNFGGAPMTLGLVPVCKD
jgi:hypothetical protein